MRPLHSPFPPLPPLPPRPPGAHGRRAVPADRRRRRATTVAGLAALLLWAAGGRLQAAETGAPTPLAEASVARLSVLALDGDGPDARVRWRRDFEHAELLALPQHSLVATTPWHGQAQRFTGPLLRDVLSAAGARGQRLTAVGLNDYRADIPLEDLQRWPVIVALQVDGAPVAVRDKGPLMVMYPFDDDRSLRRARYFARAVWQLRALELR